MVSDQQIIYITGCGGVVNKGLGTFLKTLDSHRIFLSVNNQFPKLRFEYQVAVVAKLIREFYTDNTMIIANSYGAYLCFYALNDAPHYLSKFLLLSPVIGSALDAQTMAYPRLPGYQRDDLAVAKKCISKPNLLVIHVGDRDAGYD